MATKKAASTAKKSAAKKTTKVTTVKATKSRNKAANLKPFRLNFSKSPMVVGMVAEFVGTFVFAAAIIASQGQPVLVLFALVGIVLAFGALSGAYVNPALTVAGWLTRRLAGARAVGYVVAQVLGAMLALVVLNEFVKAAPAPNPADMYSSAPSLFKAAAIPAGKEWLVFWAEVLGTGILGFAVANATRAFKDRTTSAALTVGLGVFLGLMIAGSAASFVGANAILNPAVAVSLQAINFASAWPVGIYVVGTTIGGVVGFVLYDFLRSAKQED